MLKTSSISIGNLEANVRSEFSYHRLWPTNDAPSEFFPNDENVGKEFLLKVSVCLNRELVPRLRPKIDDRMECSFHNFLLGNNAANRTPVAAQLAATVDKCYTNVVTSFGHLQPCIAHKHNV